jgi:hypothetical protein
VGEAGLEPTTPGLEGRCSIQLSYSPVSAIVPSSHGASALLHRQRKLGAPLPRFPVEACGVDTLHAPFLNERRTRGSLWHGVAGNRGQADFACPGVPWGLSGIPRHSTRRFCLL